MPPRCRVSLTLDATDTDDSDWDGCWCWSAARFGASFDSDGSFFVSLVDCIFAESFSLKKVPMIPSGSMGSSDGRRLLLLACSAVARLGVPPESVYGVFVESVSQMMRAQTQVVTGGMLDGRVRIRSFYIWMLSGVMMVGDIFVERGSSHLGPGRSRCCNDF